MSAAPHEHAMAALVHVAAARRALKEAALALEDPESRAASHGVADLGLVVRRIRNLALFLGADASEVQEVVG